VEARAFTDPALASRLLTAHGVTLKIWFTIMGIALSALNERRAKVLAERDLSSDRSSRGSQEDDHSESREPGFGRPAARPSRVMRMH